MGAHQSRAARRRVPQKGSARSRRRASRNSSQLSEVGAAEPSSSDHDEPCDDHQVAETLVVETLMGARADKVKGAPENFYCPISLRLMEDPVSCPEGHNFDRSSIEPWLRVDGTCPISRCSLQPCQLRQNEGLWRQIDDFKRDPDILLSTVMLPAPAIPSAPQIPDDLRAVVVAAHRRGRTLKRRVALVGAVGTGKSSLLKALHFENAFPLLEAVDESDAAAMIAATEERFNRATASGTFGMAINTGGEGSTTDAHEIPLNPHIQQSELKSIGTWQLVDVPASPLPGGDSAESGAWNQQRPQQVATAESVLATIDRQFQDLDAVVVVIDRACDDQLYDVFKRAIEVLRAKNNLEPGSDRWHDAINRLFIVKTKADIDLVNDLDLLDKQNPETWLSNRHEANNAAIQSYVADVASHLTSLLNDLETDMATKHRYAGPLQTVVLTRL